MADDESRETPEADREDEAVEEPGERTIAFGTPDVPGPAPAEEAAEEVPPAGLETVDATMNINARVPDPAADDTGIHEAQPGAVPKRESTQPTIMFQRAEDKPADLPVKKLGEYTLLRRLGAGGMGEVFLARQESLDREVALKILPKEVAQDKELVERFYREARSAARLIHPNVVQMYFVGQEEESTFFAMEYVDGEDLSHRLRRGESFTLEESVNIVASVCMALSVAGEQNIVHRDIKPANVMIDRTGIVKVMDFGLAKATTAATHITQAGFVLGTPTYMSPEQGEGRDVDTRSDIYSLGIVFYELLTGETPFQSENPASLIYQHIHNEPTKLTSINPEIPEEVEEIALRCLAKKPEDRYASAEELLDALMDLKEEIRGTTQATIMFDVAAARDLTVRTPIKTAGVTLADAGPHIDTGAITPPPATAYGPAPGGGITTVAAAVFIVLAILGALAFGFRRELSRILESATQTASKTGGGTSQPGPITIPNPAPDKAVLPLSELKLYLPEEVIGEVRGSYTIGEARKPLEFHDVEIDPAKVKLHLERKGYKPLEVELDCKTDGVEPRLSEEMFVFEPSVELVGAYERAAALMEAGKYSEGLAELETVDGLDPAFRDAPGLRKKAEDALAAESRRLEGLWQQAFDAFKDKKYSEAKKFAEGIPATHKRAQEALKLISDCDEKLQRAKKDEMRARSALAKGLLTDAELAMADLELVASGELLDALRKDVTDAKSLKEKAEEAMGAGDYAAASKHLQALLKVCPESEATKRDITRCSQIVKTADSAQRLILQAESRLDNGDFEGARAAIKKLEAASPGHVKIAELTKRTTEGTIRKGVTDTLSSLDRALEEGKLKKWVDAFHPVGGETLRAAARSGFEGFGACGVVVEESSHSIDEMLFAERRATASTMWKLELVVPDVGRTLSATVSQTYTLRRFGEKWLISAVSRRGGTTAKAKGGEAVKRIQGKVTAIEGDMVTIDRGRAQGVREKMIFNIYRDAQALKLPMTDEVVLVREQLVGEARVVSVAESSCTASIISREKGGEVAAGMLAVYSPAKAVKADVPQIVGTEVSPEAAAMGSACRIEMKVANVDDVFVHYVWKVDGGLLAYTRTSRPVNSWVAPAKAGDYSLTVALFTPQGRSRVTRLKLTSTGPPAKRPTGYAVTGIMKGRDALFEELTDICFDGQGEAYLLDGRKRLVIRLDRHFRRKAISERFKGTYTQILAHGGNLFFLDANTCQIHRFPVNVKQLLAGQPQAIYGGRGSGNGQFEKPADMALNSEGELLVLDSERLLVHLFGRHGRFVYSFGSKGSSVGELSVPVAVAVDADDRAYILDAKRLKVLMFEDARFSKEFSIDPGQALDMQYDMATDTLLVLYGDKLQRVQGYSTAGKKLAGKGFGGAEKAPGESPGIGKLAEVQSVVTDGVGYAYVVSGGGKRLDRFDSAGSSQGRVGGEDLGSTLAMAVGAAGDLHLLDSRSGVVRRLDRDGWMTARFGGRGSGKGEIRTPADIACDDDGNIYILDASAKPTVYRFSPDGRSFTTIGKSGRGRSADGLTKPVALAVHSKRLVVALNERNHALHVYTHDGAPQLIMPAANAQIGNPSAVALDGRGGAHVAVGRGRSVSSYNAEGRKEKDWQQAFRSIKAMACGPDNYVHVVDSSLRTLFSADPKGGKAVFLNYKLPDVYRSPADVAVDGLGNVYFLDDSTKDIVRLTPRR